MNKRKVLIIEDDLYNREMYQIQFERSGCEVVTAKDGEEGLSSVSKEKPDLVLLDIILPKMDGVTVLEKLREKEKGQKAEPLPVILLTNLGQEPILERCLKLGASGFITKARFTPQEVVQKTEELFSKNGEKMA